MEAQIAESFGLGWKGEAYGNSDKDKRELACDVAALANTAGGLIVLGVAEDEHARASATPRVALSDAYRNQLLQVLASSVAPVPLFDVRMVADGGDARRGFVIIAVERSAAAPHAVAVGTNLRYPRREGTITRYLTEPEVADAYRTRWPGTRAPTNGCRKSGRTESHALMWPTARTRALLWSRMCPGR